MEVLLFVLILFLVLVLLAIFTRKETVGDSNWKEVLRNNAYKYKKASSSTNYVEVKDALIESDKLLDFFLKNKRFKGDTLGERLKSAKSFFSKEDYNDLWQAHKLRNQLVHEVDHAGSISQTKKHLVRMLEILGKYI